MGPKARVAVWIFLLLAGMALQGFSQQFIKTDAMGGIFPEDQDLSFSISGPGWLRLLLDNREIYRGKGPAYPELGVNWGEERGFTLSAEYYSQADELLESRSWYIYIDKNRPSVPDMEIRNGPEGLRLVQSGGKQNVRIRAWADIDGSLAFFPDLGGGGLLPADSFPALIWAEDMAGNCSEPRSEYFEISLVKIENPVSGDWLNPQVLIISGAEGKNVYWTADGTHPLAPGGTGRLYLGPERIEKRGRITLRIAWRDSVGRVWEDRVDYSVTGNNDLAANLNSFRLTEERPVSSLTVLPLPENWRWSIGGVPRDQGGGSVSLRPERLIRRVAAVHLSPVSGVGGIYRFAYLLDGADTGERPQITQLPQANISLEGTYLYSTLGDHPPQRPENQLLPLQRNDSPPLRLVSAGRSRIIIWPRLSGTIYYSWGNAGQITQANWLEGKGPLLVPLEGGLLRWFVLDGRRGTGKVEVPAGGSYSVAIKPLPGDRREINRGRIICRNYTDNGNSPWEYVSGPLAYTPGILKNRASPLDVCDGEDLEWAFAGSGGRILERLRRDRLAPAAPQLDAPPEGGWTRGPVKVSVISGEKGVTGIITARLRYASGQMNVLSGTGSLEIGSDLGETAEVTVESLLLDDSGNMSPRTIRHFTVDPKTIYVSTEPLLIGTSGASAPPGSLARGGMDNPFNSLEEAMDFAQRQDLGDIRISGIQELRRPVTISKNIRIDGGYGNAALILGDGFSWNINSGASLILSGLRLERKGGDNPLIRAAQNGKVEITGADITNTGPLVVMDGGACGIKDSRISVKITGEKRIAAFSARGSGVELNDSRVQLEANYGLLFDLGGGSFGAKNSVLLAAGGRTASLFVLNGTRGNFINLSLQAAAGDYASVLEASASELVMSGGIMEASARDTTALLLDNCAAVILDASIRVEGAFSARAAEIRGAFPQVRNSRFNSIGRAKKSEVFSGMDATAPPGASITGNRFSGFAFIWGESWPLEKLKDFNLAYATAAEPNLGGEALSQPQPSGTAP